MSRMMRKCLVRFLGEEDTATCASLPAIDHEALLRKLNTFPTIRRQVRAWLKAGVMEGKQLFPTSEGTPQGGVISPLLANIALHGMENRIKQAFPKTDRKVNGVRKQTSTPDFIRYADDFVILHEDITVVQRCQLIIAEWLKDIGLELKPSKTRMTHTLNKYEEEEPGFNFLGFFVRQFPAGKHQSGKNPKGTPLGFTTIITPSKEKQKVHYDQVARTIDAHKAAPHEALINNLNPIIRGWANYYSAAVSKEAYCHQDHLMYQKLRAWAKSRHPNKSKKWIKAKYWQSIDGDNWAFATRQKGNNPMRLLKHVETPIERHEKVKGEASPYDGNLIYWSSRRGTHPEVTQRVATLLKKQKGKCTYCELYFREEDVLEVDHIIPKTKRGKDEYKNLQILHRHCHDVKTAEDGSAGGTYDKRQIIEEPDETKVSRPVLKTSGSREGIA